MPQIIKGTLDELVNYYVQIAKLVGNYHILLVKKRSNWYS